jgi:CRP-like cAMP-binding protein
MIAEISRSICCFNNTTIRCKVINKQGRSMKHVNGKMLIDEYGVDYFKNTSTFGALQDDVLCLLIENGETIQCSAGQVLFDIGIPSDCFYVLLTCSASLYKYNDGRYSFIRNYLQGEPIGFVGMIALVERNARVVINEEGYVLKISDDLFHTLYKRNPQNFALLLMNLCRDMARGLIQVDNAIVAERSRPDNPAAGHSDNSTQQ